MRKNRKEASRARIRPRGARNEASRAQERPCCPREARSSAAVHASGPASIARVSTKRRIRASRAPRPILALLLVRTYDRETWFRCRTSGGEGERSYRSATRPERASGTVLRDPKRGPRQDVVTRRGALRGNVGFEGFALLAPSLRYSPYERTRETWFR